VSCGWLGRVEEFVPLATLCCFAVAAPKPRREAAAPAPKKSERPDVKGGTFTPASAHSFEGLLPGGLEWHAVFLQAHGFGETGVVSSQELVGVSRGKLRLGEGNGRGAPAVMRAPHLM
jgi:hypothetical protein